EHHPKFRTFVASYPILRTILCNKTALFCSSIPPHAGFGERASSVTETTRFGFSEVKMRAGRLWRTAVIATGCLLAASGAAWAQSAISGTVKDASGAVLPGVTVTATSPALIEKSKTTVSDPSGQYRIVDLRPGTYEVNFELTGFQTVKREGVELPANFTATVNADMKVGAVQETITVTGASPLVDVQTTAKSEVLSRDLLDA